MSESPEAEPARAVDDARVVEANERANAESTGVEAAGVVEASERANAESAEVEPAGDDARAVEANECATAETSVDDSTSRAPRTAKIALAAATAGMLVLAWRLGALEIAAEPERLRAWILERGAWGQLVFVLAYAMLQPFGVPGTVFLLVAPLLWSWPEAYALTMAGTMAASVVGFSFARFIARDFVARRIPARFRAYEEALERRAFVTVVALRFVLWMPPALHAFFGVSRVSFTTHFWGSLIGYALPLLAMAYFGERLFQWLAGVPAVAWAIAGVVLATIAVTVTLVWLRRRHVARGARVLP